MNNLKTYEEFKWPWSKKELTPDEEYQKQKKDLEKEWAKVAKTANKPREYDPNDPYGEELDPDAEEVVAKQMKAQADYYERTGGYDGKASSYSSGPRSSSTYRPRQRHRYRS
jgi:hypothetical protein